MSTFQTGRVHARYASGVRPGPGGVPVPIPARGSVAFTAEIPYVPYPGVDGPITFLQYTVRGILDAEGYLCEPDPDDESKPGKRGVLLIACNDPQTSVEDWTWTATPRFTGDDGRALPPTVAPFSFFLSVGEDLDLTTVVKVPSSPGVGTAQAEAAVALAQVSAREAAQDAEEAQGAATRSAEESALAQASATTSSRQAATAQEAASEARDSARTSASQASQAQAAATASAQASAVAKGAATTASQASQEATAQATASALEATRAAKQSTTAQAAATRSADSATRASTEATLARTAAQGAELSAAVAQEIQRRADAGEFDGEVGGWNSGTDLGTTHLDTIFTPGLYRQWNGNNAILANGYPTATSPGVLRVSKWSGEPNGVLQEFVKLGSGGVVSSSQRPRLTYKRYYGNQWSEWSVSAPSRVEWDGKLPNTKRATIWDETSNTWLGLASTTPNTLTAAVESFNDIIVPGSYHWNQTEHKDAPPVQPYGRLDVAVSSTTPLRITQSFYPQTTGAQSRLFFQRTYVNGFGWYPWATYTSQRVDNKAGRAVYTWDELNGREQLVYGDTGWRNVASLLEPGWYAVSIRIRRVGQAVTVAFDGLAGPDAGHVTFLKAIPGFTADSTLNSAANQRHGPIGELGGTSWRWASPEPGTGDLRILHYLATTKMHGTFTYFTADPWPTALPGNANGPMPAAN